MLCFQPRLSKETNVLDAKKSIKTVVSCLDLRTVAVALGIGPDELEGFRQSLENKTEKGRENGSEIELLFTCLATSDLANMFCKFRKRYQFYFPVFITFPRRGYLGYLAALGFLRPKPIGILGENWRYSGVESSVDAPTWIWGWRVESRSSDGDSWTLGNSRLDAWHRYMNF